jgi:hypothetical protein
MTATTFLVFYRFKAMSKEEKRKAESEWHQLRNSLPSGIELVGDMFMHGEPRIMDSCYSKLRVLIRFLIGGHSLRIL